MRVIVESVRWPRMNPGLIASSRGVKWCCPCGWRVRLDELDSTWAQHLENAIERHEWEAHDVA